MCLLKLKLSGQERKTKRVKLNPSLKKPKKPSPRRVKPPQGYNQGPNNSQFIPKLWEILDKPAKYGRTISWDVDGKKVCIHDVRALSQVLAEFFRGTQLSSIERQFTWYAFKKVGLQYWHPEFRRNNPSCVRKMGRKEPGKKTNKKIGLGSQAVFEAKQWAVDRSETVDERVFLQLSAPFANEYGFDDDEVSDGDVTDVDLTDVDLTDKDLTDLTSLTDVTDVTEIPYKIADSDGNATNHHTMESSTNSLIQPHIERGWLRPHNAQFFERYDVWQQMHDRGFDETVQAYHSLEVRNQKDPEHAADLVSKKLA